MARLEDAATVADRITHSSASLPIGPGPLLAPILETDDVVVENEKRLSVECVIPDDGGRSAVQIARRRGSAIVSAIDTTRRPMQERTQTRKPWREVAQRATRLVRSMGARHAKTPPEPIRAMSFRARINFYLEQPEDSQVGWLVHITLLLVLVFNAAVMATETLDGPRFSGADPEYAYLPGDSVFLAAEVGFTAIYVTEFGIRVTAAKSYRTLWKSRTAWVDFVSLSPFFVYQIMRVINRDDPTFDSIKVRASINWLRLARLLRILVFARVFTGAKVMSAAIKESIGPLKITLFFLITVVMVFATAIFYAEPCYDLRTCTFTDIFNAGYFVMVTVATVGYGHQVPSLYNGGSLLLTCAVMIFGSLYLAMPLAIIGIRYDSAWRQHERKKREASDPSKELDDAANMIAQAAATVAAATRRNPQKTKRESSKVCSLRHELIDEGLQPLESKKVFTLGFAICDRFYDVAHRVSSIHEMVQAMFDDTITQAVTPSRTSILSLTSLEKMTPAEAAELHKVKTRNEITMKVLEEVTNVLRAHKKICTDIRGLLPIVDQEKHKGSMSSATLSMTRRENGSFSAAATLATGMFGRARRALSVVGKTRSERLVHQGSVTWRSRAWDILEHKDLSRRGKLWNRIRLYIVILSIALFYAQTMPELQQTGVKSSLCLRSISDFCASSSPGFSNQPGCFALDAAGKSTGERLDFDCGLHDTTTTRCYGNEYNYGSDQLHLTCAQAFGRKGMQRICNNRLCKPPVTLWVDMEPKWIYFEFFFGAVFTIELIVRILVHPDRRNIFVDLPFIIDVVALFPFYVEIIEIIAGTMPVYSVVPTAPSFLAVIRVFKTFRVLKLGTHISGSKVLARTARLVYKRLMIPVFFLFIGSGMCGAIFYEIERGTECFVGQQCIWWGKSILTPAIASRLPDGKRIMIQNENRSLIVDLLRSSWFSIVTITTVGYGDLYPRTPLGRFFDILTMIMSACYTAMPLTLVGGQFFVCYEVFLREKKRKARATNPTVEPKPLGPEMPASGQQRQTPAGTDRAKDAKPSDPALISIAGLTEDPVIPGLKAPIPIVTAPVLVSRRDVTSSRVSSELRRPVISTTEMQILNQFILIHKVLSQILEDLSQLNRLGSQRIATKKDKSDEIAAQQRNEADIEAKISDNLVFCVTVFLTFAPVIEKILVVRR